MATLLLLLACLACEGNGYGQPVHSSQTAEIQGIKSLASLFLDFNLAQACSSPARRIRCLEHLALVKPTLAGRPVMTAKLADDFGSLRWKQTWVSKNSVEEDLQAASARLESVLERLKELKNEAAERKKGAQAVLSPLKVESVQKEIGKLDLLVKSVDGAEGSDDLAKSLGRSVLCLENVATEADRRAVVEASLPAAEEYRRDNPMRVFNMNDEDEARLWKIMGDRVNQDEVKDKLVSLGLAPPPSSKGFGDGGLVRLSDITIPGDAENIIRQSILPRFFQMFDTKFPSVVAELFDGAASLGELYSSGKLNYGFQEPSIHVLKSGGSFAPEVKEQTLNVLIPLSLPYCLQKGGFGFWTPLESDTVDFDAKPDLCLQPPAGTAMVFRGSLPFTYVPLTGGTQVVLAFSFSLKE